MNLPEKVIQEHNYEQDHFLGRLSKYRENDAENDTVLQYLDEIDISPLHLGDPHSMIHIKPYMICKYILHVCICMYISMSVRDHQ